MINTSFKILEIILIISYTCFNISFSSDPKDPQLQLYRHTGIQLYRYPGIRLSSYTGIQLYRYTGIQVSGHTGMHAPMQYPACMVDLGTLLRSKCPRVRQRLDFLKRAVWHCTIYLPDHSLWGRYVMNSPLERGTRPGTEASCQRPRECGSGSSRPDWVFRNCSPSQQGACNLMRESAGTVWPSHAYRSLVLNE